MTLQDAMAYCLVRGYISRTSKPEKKYWQNTYTWNDLPQTLPKEDREATDWQDYDPEGEVTSVVG